MELDPITGLPIQEETPKIRTTTKKTRLMREMQRCEGGGVSYIPKSIMDKVRPALNWVGRKVEYKRKPNIRHKVWKKTEYLCVGVVVDVTIDKRGVVLFVNCVEHEDHKEMWKMPHTVTLLNEDGTQSRGISPGDASYAFGVGRTGGT